MLGTCSSWRNQLEQFGKSVQADTLYPTGSKVPCTVSLLLPQRLWLRLRYSYQTQTQPKGTATDTVRQRNIRPLAATSIASHVVRSSSNAGQNRTGLQSAQRIRDAKV